MTLRALPLLLVAVLVAATPCAPLAHAGEGPPPIALEDVELLPVSEMEWALLLHEHRDLMLRLLFVGRRLERVHEHLTERADPQDGGSRKLLGEIDRLRSRLRPDLETLLSYLGAFGVDEEVLAVLDETPRGSLRVERQALRVVLRVPDLTAGQRRILERLVPATEGALLAHAALRERVPDDDLEDEILGLQKRFWRVVDATLDRDQRVALRRRLPTRMTKYADLFAAIYTLPDLTASQATRLKALLVGLEQDAAPDQGIVKRVERRLAAGDVQPAERLRLEREKQAAETRNLSRFVYAWREGGSVLTAEQRAELAAVPPLLTVRDRPGDLEAWVKELALAPHQAEALASLHRRYGPVQGRMLQRLARAALVEEGSGEDSPQREMAAVLRAQAWGEALAAARRAAHELVTDVLTREQVVDWVLGNR